MAVLTWQTIITPVDASGAKTIQGQASISGPINNVIILEFSELEMDYQLELSGIVSAARVEHYANRSNLLECYTDVDCKLVDIEFKEVFLFGKDDLDYDPAELVTRTHRGVLKYADWSSSVQQNAMTLQLYLCDYRFERNTGIEES